jgi:cytochrome b
MSSLPPRIRVWDAPTRLAHWLLVVLVAFSWWSAENNRMDWHRYSGYALLGVLVFRMYWGVVGSSTARFSQFVKGPRTVLAYVRGLRASSSEPTAHSPPTVSSIGHNPLGALSVLLLLALLLAQVGLGLFAVDIDGLESGPLSHLVSFERGRQCARAHEWVFNALTAFIALHVAAVLGYLVCKRDNLTAAMITGAKRSAASPAKFAAWWLPLPGLALAALVVWWVS